MAMTTRRRDSPLATLVLVFLGSGVALSGCAEPPEPQEAFEAEVAETAPRSLAEVLEQAERMPTSGGWFECSHGPQLIEVMKSGYHRAIIRRMIAGERNETETTFAGQAFPLYELEVVSVTLAGDFLTY